MDFCQNPELLRLVSFASSLGQSAELNVTLIEWGAYHGKRSYHATACSNVGGIEGKCIAGCLYTGLDANDAVHTLAYAWVRK
jgi:hypothetical protein